MPNCNTDIQRDFFELFNLAMRTGASVTLHDWNDVRLAENALRAWCRAHDLTPEIVTRTEDNASIYREPHRAPGKVDFTWTVARLPDIESGIGGVITVHRMIVAHVDEPAPEVGPYVDTDDGAVLRTDRVPCAVDGCGVDSRACTLCGTGVCSEHAASGGCCECVADEPETERYTAPDGSQPEIGGEA